jgi:hypothetical protein
MRNVTVIFHVTAYSAGKGFCLPREVADILKLPPRSNVALRIERARLCHPLELLPFLPLLARFPKEFCSSLPKRC